MYDLAAQRSRAAALEAELKCLKANIGPPTVAYEVIEVPVQPDDIAPPEINTAVQMSPSRPVTPIVVQGLPANITQRQPPVSTVHRPDIADALTWNPHAADTSTVYNCHGTNMSALQPPYMSSAVKEPTIYRTGSQYTQPQSSAPSDLGYTQHQSDTLSRRPVTTVSDPVHTHIPVHTFPRSLEPAYTQSTVTSTLPRQPAYMPTRSPTLVGPPPSDDVVTSALPRPPAAPGDLPSVDYTMQRVADRVDSRNVYAHSIEQLLADLPPPPPVHRQSVPLSSVRTQATANLYENTDIITSLSAHRYADTPLYVNTTPYSSAPLSQATWAVERYTA